MNSDRTVHAEHPHGEQIVRYDRSGKWYIELIEPVPVRRRRHVGIAEAVRRARELKDSGGEIYLDRPGGGAFDHRIRTAE